MAILNFYFSKSAEFGPDFFIFFFHKKNPLNVWKSYFSGRKNAKNCPKNDTSDSVFFSFFFFFFQISDVVSLASIPRGI